MMLTWRVVGIIGIAASIAFCGCGKAQKPPAATPAPKINVPLPEWAPENPSPEFLRAARVLKSYTLDTLKERARRYDLSDAESAVRTARIIHFYSASYELFGTLDDSQIERFVKVKEIRIPMKALTRPQRAAFEKYMQTFQDFYNYDILVGKLYKNGAAEDLSNVHIGFKDGDVGAGVVVMLNFWIRQRDGSIREDNTGMFAFM